MLVKQWDWILQEPDFQENEYMYDDLDLEVDIASGKYFLNYFFFAEVLVSHATIIYIVTQCLTSPAPLPWFHSVMWGALEYFMVRQK